MFFLIIKLRSSLSVLKAFLVGYEKNSQISIQKPFIANSKYHTVSDMKYIRPVRNKPATDDSREASSCQKTRNIRRVWRFCHRVRVSPFHSSRILEARRQCYPSKFLIKLKLN